MKAKVKKMYFLVLLSLFLFQGQTSAQFVGTTYLLDNSLNNCDVEVLIEFMNCSTNKYYASVVYNLVANGTATIPVPMGNDAYINVTYKTAGIPWTLSCSPNCGVAASSSGCVNLTTMLNAFQSGTGAGCNAGGLWSIDAATNSGVSLIIQ